MPTPLGIRLLYLFLHFYQPVVQAAMVVPRVPTPVAAASVARLKVVARGAASLGNLEEKILEYTHALAGVLGRRCTNEDGCLLVTVEWQPALDNDDSLHMSLSLIKERKPEANE